MMKIKYLLFVVMALFVFSLLPISNKANIVSPTPIGNCASLSYTETLTATGYSPDTQGAADTKCLNSLKKQVSDPANAITCITTCMQYQCTAEFTANPPSCSSTWVKNKPSLLKKLFGNPNTATGFWEATGSASLSCTCKDIVPPTPPQHRPSQQ
ncbi:MAG: hypothetical protein AABX72_05220 [Nanoarchaeota archaeon]|mgnify:CR=1 FL=1